MYQAITTTRKQYGFDFLDRSGTVVATHVSYGAAAIAALFDQFNANEVLWPEEAWSISEVWERTETVTTFKRVPQQPIRRNAANGRFMRTSYRENQNL